MSKRNPAVLGIWGDNGTRVIASESMWHQPIKWNHEAAKAGGRRRVFCASLADVFEDRPELNEPRKRLFRLIHRTPHLDWLLLTKRPESIAKAQERFACEVDPHEAEAFSEMWANRVWLGVSVENQQTADERIPLLRKTPAAIRFLSVEPLLEPISLDLNRMSVYGSRSNSLPWSDETVMTGISWVIVGGESGANARPCNVEWIRSIVRQCREAGFVACFVKQLGLRPVWEHVVPGCSVRSALESLTLRDSKGGDMSEWPEALRVREFPRC